MTRAEHREVHRNLDNPALVDAVHRLAVQMALEQGLPVRPDVLADYPELAPATLNEGGPHATETRNKPENPEQQYPGSDAQLRPQGNHRDVAPEEPQGGNQAGGGDQLRTEETEPDEVADGLPRVAVSHTQLADLKNQWKPLIDEATDEYGRNEVGFRILPRIIPYQRLAISYLHHFAGMMGSGQMKN